jgi:hypothetical protein
VTRILPVIHHENDKLTLAEAKLAFACGADGVFLISHDGRDAKLVPLAKKLAEKHGAERIGLNFLSSSFGPAYELAMLLKIGMIWVDNANLDSSHVSSIAKAISENNKSRPGAPIIYAGVSFKYQAHEPDPAGAAAAAARLGFIPTTSGSATGHAPDVEKIAAMRQAAGDRLAIASGITPENISQFLPMATDILVATGVSDPDGRFNESRLRELIEIAHAAA